jgi:hypothetical protein
MLVLDEFIEPTTTTGNRCDEDGASFRADRALIVRLSGSGRTTSRRRFDDWLLPPHTDEIPSLGGVRVFIVPDLDRDFLRVDHDLRLVCRDHDLCHRFSRAARLDILHTRPDLLRVTKGINEELRRP